MERIVKTRILLRAGLALVATTLGACSQLVARVGGGLTDDLAARGVLARAEIEEVWDTGWTINDNPVIGMKLRVMPADRPPYEATIEKTTVSRIATAQFLPGNALPVRFDPADPAVVAVDPREPVPAAGWSPNEPPILGIAVRPLTALEQGEIGGQKGIVVEQVARRSPAAEAGIAAGDILLEIDGRPLGDVTTVPDLVSSLAGREVGIDLLRNGVAFRLTARLNPSAP